MRFISYRLSLRAGMTAALVAGGLASSLPTAQAALPADLLLSVATPQYAYDLMSTPTGVGRPTKFLSNASDVAVSRDGTRLVYRQWTQTTLNWVLADASGRVERQLFADQPADCNTPDWSPDGTQVLFSCTKIFTFPGSEGYAALTVVNVNTGASKRILAQGRYSDMLAKWSPLGDLIAFTRVGGPPRYTTFGLNRSRVMLVRPDGTGLTPLSATATLSEHAATFAPDGRSVAFVTRAYEPQNVPVTQEDIAVARISDGATTRVTRVSTSTAARYFNAPAFAPDGSIIAALETADWQTYPIVNRVALIPAGGGSTTYAASGAALDARDLAWHAPRTAVTGTTATPAARTLPTTPSQRVVTAATNVADGPVAYSALEGVLSAPAVGGPAITLTPSKNPRGLVASADGKRFAYDRWTSPPFSTREIRSELVGGGSGQTIFSGATQCAPKLWLASTQLAVDCFDPSIPNGESVWGVLNTTTGVIAVAYRTPTYSTTAWRDHNPTWSPNGATIAFTRTKGDGTASRVMLMNADGTGIRNATTAPVNSDTGDRNPAWTPTGDLVFATSRFATLDPLFHEDLALTRPGTTPMLRLTSVASVSNVRLFAGLSVAPSGTRVLLHEETSILGDGGGRSRLILVGLSPAGLAGAPATVLIPSALPPGSMLTAWARL